MSEEPASPVDGASIAPLARGLYRLLLALSLITLAAHVIRLVHIQVLWDDGYIFQRYARHLMAGQGLSWQPDGPPVYGLTALLYVLPAALCLLVTREPSAAAMLASVASGVVFVGAAGWLLWRFVPGPRGARAAGLLLSAAAVAASSTPVHFASGMDTTFGLAFQAVYFMVAVRFARRPARARAIHLGIVGALALWVRPELLAFSIMLPIAMAVRPPPGDGHPRRRALEALAATGAGVLVILTANALYFGMPLPLPFYAKTFSPYLGGLRAAYRGVGVEHLIIFAGHYWPLLAIIAAELLGRPRRWWHRADGLILGTLAASFVVGAYHSLFALPVMAMSERFLQVLVVPLAYLASRVIADVWPTLAFRRQRAKPRPRWGLAVVGLAGVGLWLGPVAAKELTQANRHLARSRVRWDVVAHAADDGPRSYWFEMDAFLEMPADFSIASTEVGMLGIVHPNKRIIDLAGLNEPRFARSPLEPEVLLGEMRPDLLYMPHQDYGPMVEAIRTHPLFANYVHLDKRRARTRAFGVALRRDSPYFAQMKRIAGIEPRKKKR